jgi:DNA-directed RNA polymerase specialized sigma24 family protein
MADTVVPETEIVTKELQYKDKFYTFFLKGREIVNQSEFRRLERDIQSALLSYCRSKYLQIPGYGIDDLYQVCLVTLNACIYTYNNAETARTTKRAKYNTYFWHILKLEFINRKVVETKERTEKTLREQGKEVQADFLKHLHYPVSLDEMTQDIDYDVIAAKMPVTPSAEELFFRDSEAGFDEDEDE